jgi:hypothetical protein
MLSDSSGDRPKCPDCGKHYDCGDWPFACAGMGHEPGSFWAGDAQLHTSEKVVVNRNTRTGEITIPGRADRPLHPKLAAAGIVRETLDSISDIRRVEKKTGLIHERSNYHANSAQAEKDTGSA